MAFVKEATLPVPTVLTVSASSSSSTGHGEESTTAETAATDMLAIQVTYAATRLLISLPRATATAIETCREVVARVHGTTANAPNPSAFQLMDVDGFIVAPDVVLSRSGLRDYTFRMENNYLFHKYG